MTKSNDELKAMTATEALEFQDAFKKSCSYANETPELISLLYDLDLMPEQIISNGAKSRLILIVEHFRVFKSRANVTPTDGDAERALEWLNDYFGVWNEDQIPHIKTIRDALSQVAALQSTRKQMGGDGG